MRDTGVKGPIITTPSVAARSVSGLQRLKLPPRVVRFTKTVAAETAVTDHATRFIPD